MADNDQLLQHIGNLIDTKFTEKLEPLKKDLQEVKQGQTQTNSSISHINTALETLKAGQDDIREKLETKADKADILGLGAKLDKYQKQNERRFENVEEAANTHNPHKN